MIIDILKHTIVNVCKSVTYGMKKPDKKFFRRYLESVLEYRTTVLSRLWDRNEEDACTILSYFTRNLGKEVFFDLPAKVSSILFRFIKKIESYECACFDSVDLNKYSAKKMEGIKKVRDGSTGQIVNGYVLNGVSVRWIPLMMEREILEGEGEEKTTRFDIFTNQIGKLVSSFWKGYWILADRLYDDVKKYNLLIARGLRFAIRMKTARCVTILDGWTEEWLKEWKWKKVSVGDLPTGHYEVTFTKLTKPCYIVVYKHPNCKKPIRVLSNEKDPNTVERYLKRWEIERIFRSGKQEYDFEKIGTQSAQKIDNLIAIVQLCLGISAHVYGKIEREYHTEKESQTLWKKQSVTTFKQQKAVISATTFCQHMKRYLKQVSLTFNRNSIIGFIGEYMKKLKKMKYYLKRVTLSSWESSQLRLDFGC